MTEIPNTGSINQDIETKKVNIVMLFTDYWFRVPEYQRSYVWGEEQIDELIDDLTFAQQQHVEKEYFLGSMVLQKYKRTTGGVTYNCFDVLDGQQRLTTLFLMMAVLRDIADDRQLKDRASGAIYQEKDPYRNQPERLRIEFMIRDAVGDFIETYVKHNGGTDDTNGLTHLTEKKNISVSNMARAILYLRKRFSEFSTPLNDFAIFLFNRVIVIYVASENLDDAFRLFTILNARGIPLSNSDILKAMNIGQVTDDARRRKYATQWEEFEGEFGRDDFDRFLGHLRTIIVKEKARENLLKEYEEIYKKRLLEMGEPTLTMIKKYRDGYAKLVWFENETLDGDCRLRNLIAVMMASLSTDWLPPLLFYYEKFRDDKLFEFVQRLESKVAADWMLQRTPTVRIGNTHIILRAVENATTPDQLINDSVVFEYDRANIKEIVGGDIYGKTFERYLMLKTEYCLQDKAMPFAPFTRISVEHVLPQNPALGSEWMRLFTQEQRNIWINRIANLVLLSRIKNAQLGNRDFGDKKERYFKASVNVFPNVVKVMQYANWTPQVLEERQDAMNNLLLNSFK